jgi:hypothetical protein
MLCPHCGQGIHFEEQEDKLIYSYDKLDKAGSA